MEMINKKHRASYYVQLIKHRYTRPYAIFIWVTIIHDFFRFGMFVIVYWLKLTSEKVVPQSITAKTPLSDNNKYVAILLRSWTIRNS